MRTQLPLMPLGFAIAVAVSQQPVYGSIAVKPIEELVEYFTKTFVRELAQEGAEQTTKRITVLVAKHGDEVVEIMRPLGPRAVKVADELGEAGYQLLKVHGRNGLVLLEEQGQKSLALAKQYGNGAVDVLIHQPGVGETLVTHFPKHSFPAISKLSSNQAVQLSKMATEYANFPSEAQKSFAQKLAEGGDDFVVWAYKRRKELFATQVFATTGGLGAVAVLSTYKVGDAIADLVPSAPDPEKSPGLWMFLVAMPLGCATLLAMYWMRLRNPGRNPGKSAA